MSKEKKRFKVLYFTFITPSEKFGGGIGTIQSLYALSKCADVDYVGPEYNREEFIQYGIDLCDTKIIKGEQGKISTIYNTITKGITSRFYSSWKNAVDTIDAMGYDCCYLDYARQDFVVSWAKNKGLPIIVRAHNVESDYFNALYKKRKNVINFVHKVVGRESERKCIIGANKVLALTKEDKKRLIELYGDTSEVELMPVCVKHFDCGKREDLPEPYIAVTGSLWFGPNADGSIWFLKNVWSRLDDNITNKYALVIAGANPNIEILQLSKQLNNVHIYDNPNYIDAYYQQATLYVAPIFYGAGMKVKIAEALSCGLPVITTTHSSAGYEAAYEYLNICNSSDEFINKIVEILKMSYEDREKLKRRIIDTYESNYSLEQAVIIMNRVIEEISKR